MACIVIVGAFNRNTIIFVPLFLTVQALYGGFVRREWRWLLLYGVLWAAATGLVCAVQGVGVTYWTPERVLWYNLEGQWDATAATLLVLLPLLVLAFAHFQRAPLFMRAWIPPLLLYTVFFFVFGAWTETRILTPVIPVLVALILHKLPKTT